MRHLDTLCPWLEFLYYSFTSAQNQPITAHPEVPRSVYRTFLGVLCLQNQAGGIGNGHVCCFLLEQQSPSSQLSPIYQWDANLRLMKQATFMLCGCTCLICTTEPGRFSCQGRSGVVHLKMAASSKIVSHMNVMGDIFYSNMILNTSQVRKWEK